MPQEADFEFGRKAVAAGIISQERLEEALELLMSLEKVGSRKRLSDVLIGKGWVRQEDVQRLGLARTAMAPSPAASEAGGAAAPAAAEYVFAYVRPGQEPRMIVLPRRPHSVGRTSDNDVQIEETGIERRHARITFTEFGPKIWDVGTEAGVVVNGVRRRNQVLNPDDLVEIGEAMLVLLHDGGGAPRQEPVSALHVSGTPAGKFIVEEGERQGEIFYLGERAMTFGRHRAATVRLPDPRVALLHAHVAVGPSGVQVTDLKSAFGVLINGRPVSRDVLRSGDRMALGDAVLRFEATVEARVPSAEAPVAAPPEKEPEEESHVSSFVIPPDVELEVEKEDRAARLGETHPLAPAEREPDRYALGEVVLAAVEGPMAGQFFTMRRRRIVIGRGELADLDLSDASVSREHAAVTLSEKGVLEIEDLGSRNGVRINGRKVGKAVLRVGDTIRLGTTALIVDRKKRGEGGERRSGARGA